MVCIDGIFGDTSVPLGTSIIPSVAMVCVDGTAVAADGFPVPRMP